MRQTDSVAAPLTTSGARAIPHYDSMDRATAARSDRPAALTQRLIVSDLVVTLVLVGLGCALAWPWSRAGALLAAGVAATLPAAFAGAELYRAGAGRPTPLSEARRAGAAIAGLALLWLLTGLALEPAQIGRPAAFAVILGAPTLWLAVLGARRAVRRRFRRIWPERVLIIGAGAKGQQIAAAIAADPRGGVVVAGFVDDHPMPMMAGLGGIPIFPESGDLNRAITETRASRVVLAFSRRGAEDVLNTIRLSACGPVPLSVVPRFYEITPTHATVSELGGTPTIELTSASMSGGARLAKRGLDLVLATGLLVALAPVMAAVALAIKADSPGPILFRQERVGQRGRRFRIVKFRTMRTDAEGLRQQMAHLNEMAGAGPLFKMREDPRVTGVGRFLRRTSLDELPQLFNVLLGSMSLVGPRPFVTHEAVQIDGWHSRRLDLVPGITGLWQVTGRNDVPFDEMVRLDYQYVANWSVWWDLRILVGTVPAVLARRGAS